ncbi:MAG: rhodanese-like domain-containing protein [Bacteroidetes bacterium]|nr:rhodanese-like domain-containing protein [Bacteroidota bacterium]MBL7105518.1 rhodanese-like domain-containing protein [Bacteroidales bacterium]
MIKIKLFQWISALFILIFISGCTNIYENGKELAADTKPYIEKITVDELNNKIGNQEDFLLIDVRQPAEYKKGNIPGSILIPRGVLEFKIGDDAFWEEEFLYTPDKDAYIVIYCKKGDRGILAAKALNELGYSNVKNLSGGIIAWDPDFDFGSGTKQEESGCGG